MNLKLGSLFDGSGTAPLAATMCGIEPVWASEIEKYPIAVTSARFPNMKHLGDIKKIDGAAIEPVDIICGGSPCQDLSVAGKQAGLHEGERSHLFFEMTRIIKQMREATNGKYPRYCIWENVPGAFSSNKGYDFLAVLKAYAEIADPEIYVPEPKQKAHGAGLAWQPAGYVAGDGWSIAWRTVDARYWGVPQRRRRIYLVADFAGERADEILFERTGVSGNPEPGGTARKETAADAGGSAAGSGQFWISFHLQQDPISNSEATPCISGQNQASVGIAAFMGGQGAKARSIAYYDDGTTPTIKSVMSGSNTVPDVVYGIEGNTIDRNSSKNGSGVCVDVSPTMNTQDRHGIAYAADCRNLELNEELSGTLQAKNQGGHSLNYQNPVVYSSSSFECLSEGVGTLGTGTRATAEMVAVYPKVTGTLCANSHPGSYTGQDAFNDMLPVHPSDKPPRKYIVRRLTPLECCRLQGFPDWWISGCEANPITGWLLENGVWMRVINPYGAVEGSDSAKYKLWGNGMALPNMLHVMRGIVRMEEQTNAKE